MFCPDCLRPNMERVNCNSAPIYRSNNTGQNLHALAEVWSTQTSSRPTPQAPRWHRALGRRWPAAGPAVPRTWGRSSARWRRRRRRGWTPWSWRRPRSPWTPWQERSERAGGGGLVSVGKFEIGASRCLAEIKVSPLHVFNQKGKSEGAPCWLTTIRGGVVFHLHVKSMKSHHLLDATCFWVTSLKNPVFFGGDS